MVKWKLRIQFGQLCQVILFIYRYLAIFKEHASTVEMKQLAIGFIQIYYEIVYVVLVVVPLEGTRGMVKLEIDYIRRVHD